jgi:hypothetical protein
MATVWYGARRELVNRWRSLLVLGILAGLAGGITTAAVAENRRTSTVFDRRKATRPPHLAPSSSPPRSGSSTPISRR